MIPAKITSLSPVQVTYKNWINKVGKLSYKPSTVIADVENVINVRNLYDEDFTPHFFQYNDNGDVEWEKELSLNQSCFIELTGESKAKIVKL